MTRSAERRCACSSGSAHDADCRHSAVHGGDRRARVRRVAVPGSIPARRDVAGRRGAARCCSACCCAAARDGRSGQSLQVIGQYAFLLDTLRIGAGPGADVRIPAPSGGRGGTGLVSVHFRPNDSSFVVRAAAASPPVVVGDRVLAAAPVGRGATLALTPGRRRRRRVSVAMPWWPIGCTTRIASLCSERTSRQRGRRSTTVRVPENGVWSDALDPAFARLPSFVLFRRDGKVYVAAGARTSSPSMARLLPSEARAATGAIEIGIGREVSRLRVVADRRANRMQVLFGGPTGRRAMATSRRRRARGSPRVVRRACRRRARCRSSISTECR